MTKSPHRRPARKQPSSGQPGASPRQEPPRTPPAGSRPRSGLQKVLLAILRSKSGATPGSRKPMPQRELSRRERRQQQRLSTQSPQASAPHSPESFRRTAAPHPMREQGRSVIPIDAQSEAFHSEAVPRSEVAPRMDDPPRTRLHSVHPKSAQRRSPSPSAEVNQPPAHQPPVDQPTRYPPQVAVLRKRSEGHTRQGHPRQRPPAKGTAPRSFSMIAFVQGMRLVILGVGVWAIMGTVLSMANPQMRSNQGAYADAEPPQDSAYVQGLSPNSAMASSLITGQPMNELLQRVTPIAQGTPDLTPGVFVLDLDSGDYLSLNGEMTFSAASMIKVPILLAFFQDVDAGKIRLDEMVTMLEGDIVGEAGEMQFDGAGTQYTALETAANMIIISDNTATNMIIRLLGGVEVVNQRFQEWGLQQTTLRNPLPDLEGTNEASPRELSHLLARVSEGEFLTMRSRDRFLDIMQRTVANGLLPATLGQGATIAHKTGDIGSLLGDTGLIDMPSGKRYAITVMVKRPHNDDRAFEMIRQISGVTYEYLSQVPDTSNNVGPSMPSDESYAEDSGVR
ncbi:serine hydrolase [Egbenema bharatensis]|uniref:serine hydrolase n=1 Tax=Egbenema bharatensis TaxID=3463334 RepID=UPI003A8A3C09